MCIISSHYSNVRFSVYLTYYRPEVIYFSMDEQDIYDVLATRCLRFCYIYANKIGYESLLFPMSDQKLMEWDYLNITGTLLILQ